MLRLNVAASQLDECVSRGMFALHGQPQIQPGEVLLLQLKKADWQAQGANVGRIQHALVFQHAERDGDGQISRRHWPDAGKTWPWILYSSAVLRVRPFSLEDLPLVRESHYQAQANPVRIDPADEAIILPYLEWTTASPLVETRRSMDEDAALASDDTTVVENFSVQQAVDLVKTWFPTANIKIMPHNHAGFDLLANEGSRVVRYIEVKGTRSAKPLFHLTETERRFSAENALIYTLVVIWAIDLAAGSYRIARHDGEVTVGPILRPERYAGRLAVSTAALDTITRPHNSNPPILHRPSES